MVAVARNVASSSRWPYSVTARITVAHPTPSSAANWATLIASRPTRWVAQTRARSVSTARARTAAVASDQVRITHAGSSQRQTRLSHTSSTGRPPIGRSRTDRALRSCNLATTPQPGHPVRAAVVSTTSSSSPPTSAAAVTRNPGNPSTRPTVSVPSSSGSVLRSVSTWGLPGSAVLVDHRSSGPRPTSQPRLAVVSATQLPRIMTKSPITGSPS